MREATEPRIRGSNRRDLTDRQVRHREIYWMHPNSTANSGGAGRNRGRGSGGEPVARARVRGGEGGRDDWPGRGATEPPGQAQPGGLAPIGGPAADRWASS
jgi:hypothetical protein